MPGRLSHGFEVQMLLCIYLPIKIHTRIEVGWHSQDHACSVRPPLFTFVNLRPDATWISLSSLETYQMPDNIEKC